MRADPTERAPPLDSEDASPLACLLAHVLLNSKRIVVITGAGISASAGIDTFAESTGLVRRLGGKSLFEWSTYEVDQTRGRFNAYVRHAVPQMRAAKLTPCHDWIEDLLDQGRLLRHYTQNIDGLECQSTTIDSHVPLLDQATPAATVALHGSLLWSQCDLCGTVTPTHPAHYQGSERVRCTTGCPKRNARRDEGKRPLTGLGTMRPRLVYYHQPHPDPELRAKRRIIRRDLKAKPDAVVVVGTALSVPGTRRLCNDFVKAVHRQGGHSVLVNKATMAPSLRAGYDIVVEGTSDEFARLASSLQGSS